MDHHLKLLTDRKEQVALMVTIGDVWWKEMSRVDRAEAIFSQAIQLDPESRQAVAALGRLYERSGNWNLALEMLQREARIAGASRDAVDIYVRIGAIDEDMLLDVAAAKEAYGKALALDPGCLPAVRAMKGIAEREGNRDAYLELLTAEARYAEDDEQRADRWSEVGRIFQEERDDREGAVRAFEEALKRKADHLPAARPLSDLYVGLQRWAGRGPGARGHRPDPGGRRRRQGALPPELPARATWPRSSAQRDQALRSYRRAYELDATYLPALEGLGNLLVAEGQLEEALRIFTAIIIHHRDQLTDLEVVETHWQIGEVADQLQAARPRRRQLQEGAGARRRPRAVAPQPDPAAGGGGRLGGAVEQRQRLLPTLDGRARFEALVAIGQACRDHLQDRLPGHRRLPGRLEDRPDRPAGHRGAAGPLPRDAAGAEGGRRAGADHSTGPRCRPIRPRAARLHVLLAEILRDEVKDEAGALAQFEKALDLNPRQPQAFAWVEETLGRGQALEPSWSRPTCGWCSGSPRRPTPRRRGWRSGRRWATSTATC